MKKTNKPKTAKQLTALAKKRIRLKKLFLEAHEANLGNITASCKTIKIGRQTYYDWCESDPEFAKAADMVREQQKDFVENALMKQIIKGNITSIIFYLKCHGKNRGWIDTPQYIPTDKEKIRTEIIFTKTAKVIAKEIAVDED